MVRKKYITLQSYKSTILATKDETNRTLLFCINFTAVVLLSSFRRVITWNFLNGNLWKCNQAQNLIALCFSLSKINSFLWKNRESISQEALVRIRWQKTEIKSPSQMKPLSEYLRQLGKMILQIQNVMVYIKPKFNIKWPQNIWEVTSYLRGLVYVHLGLKTLG